MATCRIDLQPLRADRGGTGLARLLVTTLGNPWLTLINFDIGDIVRLQGDDPCPCGRTEGLAAAAIEGRWGDLTFTGEGRMVTVGMLDRAVGAMKASPATRSSSRPQARCSPGSRRTRGRKRPWPARWPTRWRASTEPAWRCALAGSRAFLPSSRGSSGSRAPRCLRLRRSSSSVSDPLAFTREPISRFSPGTSMGSHSPTWTALPRLAEPRCVIDAVTRVYTEIDGERAPGGARPCRRGHGPIETARQDDRVVSQRLAVGDRVHAQHDRGINMVAAGLRAGPDDEVVLTPLEHHSNYLPWRLRARTAGRLSRRTASPSTGGREPHCRARASPRSPTFRTPPG